MPSKKGSKKAGSKPRSTEKRATQMPSKLSRNRSRKASASSQAPKFNLRSRSSAHSVLLFESNPESILRNSRKSRDAEQTQDRPERLTQAKLAELQRSVRALPIDQPRQTTYGVADEFSEEEASTGAEDTDSLQVFYSSWGYLPPLGEEALAVIEAIITHSEMADEYTRIGPENPLFPHGLQYRNVSIEVNDPYDSYMDDIKRLTLGELGREIEEESESNQQLWTWDQGKCEDGSNEALFQRTLMMSLIARHRLIYKKDESLRNLDFSVEESWGCPPMPTRAYWKKTKFLTQPKPDLAVSFSRKAIVSDLLWESMPIATMRLACFENTTLLGQKRIFHFFTVEAKRANTSSDDIKGKLQSLNNASQALHNMYEFFRDAGSQHEEIFFNKVRFFSVVTSSEGLTIRIHRAIRLDPEGPRPSFIMPENPAYPLRFEYREFFKVERTKFNQETISKIIQQILIVYGVGELRLFLKNAAEALMNRLFNDLEEMQRREDPNFYRYGQTVIAPSKRPTPAKSRALSKAATSSAVSQHETTPNQSRKKQKTGK